ncbi:MAG: TetR/AcrR family transcriptional regulator [Bacteroidetes bacterium]|nr:TetR/AcrR family transcriptional regulator [Bacteroidota bacterium]
MQIVQTGKDLFWKFGVRRVSIEEICTEARVSKVTFYKHFKNKVDLAKYILENNFAEALTEYREIMDSDIPFVDKINSIIQMKLNNANKYSKEFLEDLYKGKIPELYEYLINYSKETFKMVAIDFKKAQEEGHFRKDVKIDFLMIFLKKMIDLAGDPDINSLYKTPSDMIKEFTHFFFYGTVARDQEI